jgi:hypothetical protein
MPGVFEGNRLYSLKYNLIYSSGYLILVLINLLSRKAFSVTYPFPSKSNSPNAISEFLYMYHISFLILSLISLHFYNFSIQRKIVKNQYLDTLVSTIKHGDPIPLITLTYNEKGLKRKKMQSNVKHQQFNTMPKLAGLIASGWLAINCGSLSYDRTPEIHRVRETVV